MLFGCAVSLRSLKIEHFFFFQLIANKQGRKCPLDTPKRMIKRREREGKREKKGRRRDIEREGEIREREGERGIER